MYEAFYGFREKPFSLLPDPDYLYLSDQHQMAMTLLEYSLENQAGFCVISGNIGTGKTTLIRYLLNRIGNDISVGLISNTHQSFGELLRWILHAFNLESAGKTKAEMHQVFSDYLIAQYARNRRTMIIVDEAQNMSPAALEELRMLSNINSEKDLVLQVMLVGQPGLRELLQRSELEQLTQRVAVDYHLKPLSGAETRGYIRHRISVVGGDPDLFSDGACDAVFHYSGGTPRLINLLCDLVLVYAYAEQVTAVSRDLVDQVVRERQAHGVLPIFAAGALPPERPGEGAATTKNAAPPRPSAAAPVTPRDENHADAIPVDARAPVAPVASGGTPASSNAAARTADAMQPDSVARNDIPTPAAAMPDASPEPAAPPQNISVTIAAGSADATPTPGKSDAADSADTASIPLRRTKRWWVAGAAAVLMIGAASVWWLYSETPSPVSPNAVVTPAPSPAPVESSSANSLAVPNTQTGAIPPAGPVPDAASTGTTTAPNVAPPLPASAPKPKRDTPAATAKPMEREQHAVPVVTRHPLARDPASHRDTNAAKVAAPAKPEPAAPAPASTSTAADNSAVVQKAAEPATAPIKTVAEAAPVPVTSAPAAAPRAEEGRSGAAAKPVAEPATEFSADPCKGPAARFLSTCK